MTTRIIGCIGLVVWPTSEGRWFHSFGLTYMDGGWYRIIVTIGYPNGALIDAGTAWPFSPLYPFVADVLTRIGAPVGPSLILVSWFFALITLIGLWELVVTRFDKVIAQNTVWCMALLPGAVGQVLSYSDSMFTAGLVWMLIFIDRAVTQETDVQKSHEYQWWLVGFSALVVTASRPNGILILLACLYAVWMSQRKIVNALAAILPSITFFLCWMIYCKNKTGDALAFLTAKNTWLETTIFDFLSDPFERPAIVLHMATFTIVASIAFFSWKKVPIWWHLVSFVLLAPSLVLGVEGMARYVSLALPMSVLVGLTLSKWSKVTRMLFLMFAGCSLLFLAVNVVRSAWVP